MTESEEEKELFKNTPNLLNFEHLFPFLNEKQSAPVKREKKSTVKKTNKKQNKTTAVTNQGPISPLTPSKDSHLSKEAVSSLDETKGEMSQPKQESILKEKIVIQKPKSSSIHKNGSKLSKKKELTSPLKVSEIIDFDEEFDESILERLGDKDHVSFIDEKMVNGEVKRTHYDIRNIDLSKL